MFHKKEVRLFYILALVAFICLLIFLFSKTFPFLKHLILFFWQLSAPFIIAIFIAYLLYPLVVKLHNWNIQKPLAILFIYFIFFGGIAYSIYLGYPAIVHQVRDLNEQLPHVIRMYEALIYQLYESTSFLPETVHEKMDKLIYRMELALENILEKLVGGVTKLFDFIIVLTVIPVLVFYFLKDYLKIKDTIKRFLPAKHRAAIEQMIHAIDKSLGNYIRGQMIVAVFVMVTTWVVFYFMNIKYALLLAVIIGLTNIIPYFGPIIGTVPAVLITLSVSGKLAIIVIVVSFVIQLVESNFLSPYIVGRTTKIHPVTIIFVLLLGAKLSGIIGMIVAVPIYMICKEVFRHTIGLRLLN
ncbi:AI-2E family transporter [Virgibacillus sp. W0430]|uniref:AI-2E family transporter n=1 Tax=Virgibacillus sp. W0430 TaxID=3391580 RepID=UPI003F485E39